MENADKIFEGKAAPQDNVPNHVAAAADERVQVGEAGWGGSVKAQGERHFVELSAVKRNVTIKHSTTWTNILPCDAPRST
jgi:hypothetical protein